MVCLFVYFINLCLCKIYFVYIFLVCVSNLLFFYFWFIENTGNSINNRISNNNNNNNNGNANGNDDSSGAHIGDVDLSALTGIAGVIGAVVAHQHEREHVDDDDEEDDDDDLEYEVYNVDWLKSLQWYV